MRTCKVLSSVQVDPKSFRRTTSTHVHDTKKVYRVSAHAAQRGNRGALVDRGANGSIIGNDAHVLYTHTQDKKLMLLGSITTRLILSRLSTQVQRHSHNVVKPSEYSDSAHTTERGEPSTHLVKLNGTQAMSFMIDLSKSEALNTSVPLMDTCCPLTLTTDYHTSHRFPTLKRSSMNSHTSYSLPLRNGIQLFLTTSCPPNQTGSTSSRTTLKTDTYVLPLSMLTGTTHVDILTRNLVLVTRRFSTWRSGLFLVSRPTKIMMTTPQ